MIDSNITEYIEIKTTDKLFLGCYSNGGESIMEAQISTIDRLLRLTPKLKKSSKLLFLCNDYIFVPFYIATVFNSKIHILCEDEEKERDILKQIEENNLSAYIQTSIGTYNYLNFDFDYFDFVWSINALSQKQELLPIMREIKGVLTPQGRLILVEEVLNSTEPNLPIDYLHSFLEISKIASASDLEKISQIDLSEESKFHYQSLSRNEDVKSDDILNQVLHQKSLTDDGLISWNFIQFQKRNS